MANTCLMYVRFCLETSVKWMWENKLVTFFGLLSFCLFVSTWALASQRNAARQDLSDFQSSLTTTTKDSTTTTEAGETTVTTTENTETTTGSSNGKPNDTDSSVTGSRVRKLLGYTAS